MARLGREARVAIEALVSRGTSKAAVARLLGVTGSTVDYHAGRMSAGATDGAARRSRRRGSKTRSRLGARRKPMAR